MKLLELLGLVPRENNHEASDPAEDVRAEQAKTEVLIEMMREQVRLMKMGAPQK